MGLSPPSAGGKKGPPSVGDKRTAPAGGSDLDHTSSTISRSAHGGASSMVSHRRRNTKATS